MLELLVGGVFFKKVLLLSGLVIKVYKKQCCCKERKRILTAAHLKCTDSSLLIQYLLSFGMAQSVLAWPCLILPSSFLLTRSIVLGSRFRGSVIVRLFLFPVRVLSQAALFFLIFSSKSFKSVFLGTLVKMERNYSVSSACDNLNFSSFQLINNCNFMKTELFLPAV